MGCFSTAKNSEESLPSIRSILATKEPGLPTPPKRKTKFGFITPKALQARSALLRSVSLRLVRARPRALSFPTSSSDDPASQEHHRHRSDSGHSPERFISHSAHIIPQSPFPVDPASLSGPIPSNSTSNPPVLFPLPLPPDHSTPSSKSSNSSRSPASNANLPSSSGSARAGSHVRSGSLSDDQIFSGPMPLPYPTSAVAITSVREFSAEQLAAASENFNDVRKLRDAAAGPVYRALIKEQSESDDPKETDVAVARVKLTISRKKWKAQVLSLARLAHPNLCKIIGFAYEDSNDELGTQSCEQVRGTGFLIYENFPNGSLDRHLYNQGEDEAPMDWSTRMNIAVGAAEGLAFLHERTSKQIAYNCFKTNSVQLDAMYNAKLSDFGCAAVSTSGTDQDAAGDVLAFGVVLLELLTGKHVCALPTHGAPPLDLMVDRHLMGRYPIDAAKVVSDLIARCLLLEPSLRPSMCHVARLLRIVSTQPTMSSPSFLLRPSFFLPVLKNTHMPSLYKKKRSLSFG